MDSAAFPIARWRALTPSDLQLLLRIAETVHPDLPEDAAVFAERIKLFPDGCRILMQPSPPPSQGPRPSLQPLKDGNSINPASNDQEEALGYMISHPILANQPPSLNALLGSIPPLASIRSEDQGKDQEDQQYYIHDLALLPAARGQGYAASGIASVLSDPGAPALKYSTTSLVSVYGTAPFWRRFGFEDQAGDNILVEKLREYGDGAIYMVRQNAQH